MLNFAEVFMKNIIILLTFCLISCSKNSQVHPPVGGLLSQKDLEISRNRSRDLNQNERNQIKSWIQNQNEKFYPMAMNYWVNKEDLISKPKKLDGTSVSYQYDIYDFDNVKLYPESVIKKNVQLGKFEDLKAVENVVRYLKSGEEATLLVPSVLAFGTYGDNKKIPSDLPVIIKIKVF
ncbi:FKBP-type peptidyl-prolyl cis-trans isomerase [Halpernia sp.]|uniref:FKBP-type peptidyl-prolyl cis-trans isomerase n=1 Tax=Halpernia sp. TaxID=2782209 RepID=UPI003A94086A